MTKNKENRPSTTTDYDQISKALAEALLLKDQTPIQPATPAATYIALCYDDPVIPQGNVSLLHMISKDQFQFPLCNAFIDGLLQCCSRSGNVQGDVTGSLVEDYGGCSADGFAEVVFHVLIHKPYRMIVKKEGMCGSAYFDIDVLCFFIQPNLILIQSYHLYILLISYSD